MVSGSPDLSGVSPTKSSSGSQTGTGLACEVTRKASDWLRFRSDLHTSLSQSSLRQHSNENEVRSVQMDLRDDGK